MAQAFSYAPKYEPPLRRSRGEIKPRSDFKASAALAISEFFSDVGLGDTKGNYELASKLMDVTPVGPVLDAASALLNQSEGAGLDVALALSDALFLPPAKAPPGTVQTLKEYLRPIASMSKAQFRQEGGDEAMRQATGWMMDPKGYFRYEIPDAGMEVDWERIATAPVSKVGDVVSHPALFSAAPEVQNYRIGAELMAPGVHGYTDLHNNFIGLNLGAVTNRPDEARGTLTHELQHVISALGGMPTGGDPRTIQALAQAQGVQLGDLPAVFLYRSLLDEVMARTAQGRHNLSAAGLKAYPPMDAEVGLGAAPILNEGDMQWPKIMPNAIFNDYTDILKYLGVTDGPR